MQSPLARVILATLGGYVMILLLMAGYDWIATEYPQRPPPSTKSSRIQHPFFHAESMTAIKGFSQLPATEKAAVVKNLQSSMLSVDEWITSHLQAEVPVFCMGELHEEATRDFLAEEIFSKISVDVLLLEATDGTLHGLLKRMDAGREYYPLLDADIMKILRTVTRRNPKIEIWGIEETDEQQKEEPGHSNSRDQSITRNFWERYQPGRRHVILFGALHCADDTNWLFNNLYSQAPGPLKQRMLNAIVLGEHQNGALEAFVYFLDEIGMEKRSFVIPDTNTLHPQIYGFFPSLNRQTLEKYRSLIVIRG